MSFNLSDEALADLRSISEYTVATWGYEQEVLYLNQIYSQLESLSENLDRCRPQEDLFPGCQSIPIGKHMIFFRIDEGIISVARVLHQAMCFPDHF